MEARSNRLAGRVALVTGVGSGIGRASALMLARHGAKVSGCDIDEASASSLREHARREELKLEVHSPCDLSQTAAIDRWLAESLKVNGNADILVNAAAWGAMVPLEEMDYHQHWKRTLVFELDIVFLACKAAWPQLKVRGGSIINFASANAYQALEGSPALAHCAGKGGVLAMTRQLAMEGAPFGIRANSISPGLVETSATEGPLRDIPGFREAVTAKHMLKRLGKPDDVAWCVLFLAGDESSWITAADIAVDGGVTKW
jgi:NAD(P)-dependent dehydrogenase (short-subunit alcohol dehydrogenase family)